MPKQDTPPNPPPETPPVDVAKLQAELAAANSRLAAFEKDKAQREAAEIGIAEKMRLGLTRIQAIAVINRQKTFDESAMGKSRAALHQFRQAVAAHVAETGDDFQTAVKTVKAKQSIKT